MTEIDIDTAGELLDFGTRLDSAPRAREQLEGAVALHNILCRGERGCAYLADEVGMGKTYVALGTLALLQHFQPNLRVLIIAPRRNIQTKWRKELHNFVAHNVRFPELRVKALDGRPAAPVEMCENLLDLVAKANRVPHGLFLARMSSFSLGIADPSRGEAGQGAARRLRDELCQHLPWLDAKALDLRSRESFKDNFARALCCALPVFDLVIVDEAHNLKHGFQRHSAARNRVMAIAFGHPGAQTPPANFPGFGSRATRVLFLSATPVEESYKQLWNQLDVFGLGDEERMLKLSQNEVSDEEKQALARRFLIRRVTEMRLGGERLSKNLYRREWRRGGVALHDDPIRVTDPRQRLVLALVQKKVAEILGHESFGSAFQIGMLASFESFQQTANGRRNTATGEDANFDADQTDDPLQREGIDVRGVNRLAASYRNRFAGAELPHPKMDALVASLADSWQTGEKSLVFVRRVASVTDLKRKLDEGYDQWLFKRLRTELPEEVQPRLAGLIEQYLRERTEARNQGHHGAQQLPLQAKSDDADEGGQDTFFAWFFRGEGPGNVMSGAALLKRFRQKGSSFATFFEDNHTAAVLDCEAGEVLQKLGEALALEATSLRGKLCRHAQKFLTGAAKKLTRGDLFEAFQGAGVELLMAHPGPLQPQARLVWHARFENAICRTQTVRELPDERYVERLQDRTFFTELRRPQWADLKAALWTEPLADDPEQRLRERELRAELLGSAARLGQGLIDLYILVIRRLKSLNPGTHEELDPAEYLHLLDEQRRTPCGQRGWRAYDELAEINSHFSLILDVNEPEARHIPLSEVRKRFGTLLGRQQPVGGMAGGVNGTLVKQFRMPGYPLALICTEVLQEGEDLHTFCSRIHHYGISWTPSSMEQRTGRIDRVSSLTERRLLQLDAAPEEHKLQVHYPHLEDTVEVLQVRRVLERMNTFLKLMHDGLHVPDADAERSLNVSREILRHHQPVPVIRQRMESAFPVQPKDLTGRRRNLARTATQCAAAVQRFMSLHGIQGPSVKIDWEPPGAAGRILGTLLLGHSGRRQPFGVYLQSFKDHLLMHCVSPVGRVLKHWELEAAFAEHRLPPMRIGALELPADATRSYDLTVEDDMLFASSPAHDRTRLLLLIERVTAQADLLEQRLLQSDEPMTRFRADLEHEHD